MGVLRWEYSDGLLIPFFWGGGGWEEGRGGGGEGFLFFIEDQLFDARSTHPHDYLKQLFATPCYLFYSPASSY